MPCWGTEPDEKAGSHWAQRPRDSVGGELCAPTPQLEACGTGTQRRKGSQEANLPTFQAGQRWELVKDPENALADPGTNFSPGDRKP